MREGEVSEGTSGLEVEPTYFYRNVVLRVWEREMRNMKQRGEVRCKPHGNKGWMPHAKDGPIDKSPTNQSSKVWRTRVKTGLKCRTQSS